MKTALTVFVFFKCLLALATSTNAPDRLASSQNDLSQAQSFKLPVRFDEDWAILQVQIGQEKGLNLLLDTGASYLAISEELAGRLRKSGSLRDLASERVITASAKFPEVRFTEVTEVCIGQFAIPRCRAAVIDMTLPSKSFGEPLDGIVGMALFEAATLIINFSQKEVCVETPGTSYKDAVVMPCVYQAHRPFVSLTLADRQFNMVVDSGFNGAFSIPWKHSRLPFVSRPITTGLAIALADTPETKQARLATNVIWGGLTFDRPIVAIGQQNEALVGNEFLKHFTLGFDQRNKLLWVVPATNAPVTSPPFKSFGYSALPNERGLKVYFVTPRTDAWEANIFPGDFITAINGKPAREWSQKQLRTLRDEADRIEVDVLRGGKTRHLQLRVSTLVE